MKRLALFLAIAGLSAASILHSQAPAPPPAAAPVAVGDAATPSTRQLLQQMRESNARLIEQQTKTLQLLEEMEKTSQTLKTLGKRA